MPLTSPPRPLPRGPHQLSRDEIQQSQRQRLLRAITEAVGEQGYVHTSVADVLARAGVSRATFYALFRDKQDCFQAAFAANAEAVAASMAAALDQLRDRPHDVADPHARLDHVLTVYLEAMRGSPALARAFLVEVYAAGPRAIEQRRSSMERFVDIVAETHRGETGMLGPEPHQRFAVEALVGAASSMVTNLVGVGDLDQLADLREPLLELAAQLRGA